MKVKGKSQGTLEYKGKTVYISFISQDNTYLLVTYDPDLKGGFFKIDFESLEKKS